MKHPLNSQIITQAGVQEFAKGDINTVIVEHTCVMEGVITPLGGIVPDVQVALVHIKMIDGSEGHVAVTLHHAMKLADGLIDWVEHHMPGDNDA